MKNLAYNVYSALLAAGLLLAGCETGSGPGIESGPASPARSHETPNQGVVDFGTEGDTLGQIVRAVGAANRTGLVLLSGLEDLEAGAHDFRGAASRAVARALAAATDNQVASTPFYEFIYPAGYEMLLATSFKDALPPRYQLIRGSVDFGAGTELYNALALMNATFEVNLVADNAIADAVTGEMALHDAPLEVVLEALFKSARIPPGAYTVDATDEYIFIGKTGVNHPRELLGNRGALTAQEQALLATVINVELPEPALGASGVVFRHSAEPLRKALPHLSDQLGMPVRVPRHMGGLPVNFFVLQGVRAETALNLLIRQWQVPRFRYRMNHGVVELYVDDAR